MMIIKEIYIGGFGKLQDFRVKFDSGLNEIKADNGWGKSTIAAFISAMLYGLDDTRSQKLDENPRKKYTPWGTEVFGGYMVFSTEKGNFRCERSFGKKASVSFDSFTLISLETGKESSAYSERLGRDIFGIDEDGFLRSAYLSERSLSEKNQNPTVSAKISRISLADADMGGYDAAEKLLDERRKFYQKRGGGGEIRDTESEASLYEGKIAAIKEKQGTADLIRRELSAVALEIDSLKKKAEEYRQSGKLLDEQAKRKLLAERYTELCIKERELSEEENRLLSFFGGVTPSGEDIRILSEARAEAEAAKAAVNSLKEQASENTEEYAGSKSEELSVALAELKRRKKAPVSLILSGLVAASIGAVCFTLLMPLGVLAVISGALIAGLGIYASYADNKSSVKRAAEIIEGLGASLKERTKSCAEATLSELILLEKKRDEARSKQRIESDHRYALIEEYEEKISQLTARASEAEKRLKTEPGTPTAQISEIFAKLNVIKSDRHRAFMAAEEFKRTSGIVDGGIEDTVSTDSKEKIDYLIANTHNEIVEAERKKASLEGELRALNEAGERLYEYEDKLAQLRERIDKYSENLSVISNTARLLAEAKERLTARYLGTAREAFDRYCLKFGLEGDFTLDTSFTLTKTELGKSRKTESFSKGTRDLFAFAVRLALTDALFEGDYPPIILDDPFLGFDDEKIKSAKQIITALSKSRQVIYLTCSESRKIN